MRALRDQRTMVEISWCQSAVLCVAESIVHKVNFAGFFKVFDPNIDSLRY